MFKILEPHCEPKRGTKYSAYVDLFSREDVVIGAGETKVVKLGVKIDLEKILDGIECIYPYNEGMLPEYKMDYFMKTNYIEVALRSSLAVKGLIIANGIGIIDLDYPDEIGLIVHNPIQYIEYDGHIDLQLYGSVDVYAPKTSRYERAYIIKKGDKVAQCTLKEHKGYLMGYDSDVIREGGYGSTGN